MTKSNYIVISSFVLSVAALGSWFVRQGLNWYKTIILPSWIPSGTFISSVWAVIFALGAVAVIIAWNRSPRDLRFYWIIVLFIINAFLNILWSYLFFDLHLMGWAALEAGFLAVSVYTPAVFLWPVSRPASFLLIPYALWVTFAAYLTCVIWLMNV